MLDRHIFGAMCWTLAFAVSGCDSAESPCTPGQQVSCACPGGVDGVQVCDSGTSAGGDNPGGGGMSAGGTSAGGGGSANCAPAAVESCYDGPAATKGVGVCVGGTRICDVNGTWGPCMNQVLPSTEDCQTPNDENCDGATPPCSMAWGKALGPDANVWQVRTDASGNVLLMGQFASGVDFGGGHTLTNVGVDDLFVAKLSADGDHVWSVQLGDPLDVIYPGALEVDSQGNVYVAFTFFGNPTILGTQLQEESNNQGDVGFIKILANGSTGWVRGYGSMSLDQPYGIAVDINDEPILIAGHSGPIYFGGANILTPPTNLHMMALVKFDGMANHIFSRDLFWARTPPFGIAMDPVTDDIVVAGNFGGDVDLGLGTVSSTAGTIFLGRFDDQGDALFYDAFGGPTGQHYAHGLQVSPSGAMIFWGSFEQSLDLGQPVPITGSGQTFVAGISSTGQHQFLRTIPNGSSFGERAVFTGIVRTSNNQYVLCGATSGNGMTDLGNGVMSNDFVVTYDATGSYVDSTNFAFANGYVYPYSLALAPDGVTILAGIYSGSDVVMGGDLLTPLVNSGAFVARLAP
jgi:hypothetical protein